MAKEDRRSEAVDGAAMATIEALQGMVNKLMKDYTTLVEKVTLSGASCNGPMDTATRTTADLLKRITPFMYDPDNGQTYEAWLNRYEWILNDEEGTLDAVSKTKILVEKLDTTAYNRYAGHILPKRPDDLTYEETVGTLKKLFNTGTSEFRRRLAVLNVVYGNENLKDYTGNVKRIILASDWHAMTADQFECMIWIAGLRDPRYVHLRMRALRYIEKRPDVTINELCDEMEHILALETDAKSIPGQDEKVDVCALGSRKYTGLKKKTPHHEDEEEEEEDPRSRRSVVRCYRCNKKDHRSSECPHKYTVCFHCDRKGHLAVCCGRQDREDCRNIENVAAIRSTIPMKKIRPEGNESNIVSEGTMKASEEDEDVGRERTTDESDRRLYLTVTVNGKKLKMLFDTGSEATMISLDDWKRLGNPKLAKSKLRFNAANGGGIGVIGQLYCDYEVHGQARRGTCYVAETTTAIGVDWVPDIIAKLNEPVNGNCGAVMDLNELINVGDQRGAPKGAPSSDGREMLYPSGIHETRSLEQYGLFENVPD